MDKIRPFVQVERSRFQNCCIDKPFVLFVMEIRTYKTQAFENASMWTIWPKRMVMFVSFTSRAVFNCALKLICVCFGLALLRFEIG